MFKKFIYLAIAFAVTCGPAFVFAKEPRYWLAAETQHGIAVLTDEKRICEEGFDLYLIDKDDLIHAGCWALARGLVMVRLNGLSVQAYSPDAFKKIDISDI